MSMTAPIATAVPKECLTQSTVRQEKLSQLAKGVTREARHYLIIIRAVLLEMDDVDHVAILDGTTKKVITTCKGFECHGPSWGVKHEDDIVICGRLNRLALETFGAITLYY